MPSEGEPPGTEDWDVIDHWGRRIGRWAAVGFPAWLLLLAAFNQDLTGIPWVVGLAMASVLATIIVVVAERTVFARGRRSGIGRFGRALVTWIIVFFVLALIVGSSGRTDAVVLLIPFVVATFVAGGVEVARRVLGRR
jgi:hypothetical protein